MLSNDRVVLQELLRYKREQEAPDLAESAYFELFAAEQILKDFDLTGEEIQAGIVAGPGDGGVDALYGFVDGRLITEDMDAKVHRRSGGPRLELHFVQAKTQGSFGETPLVKLAATADDILNLSNDLAALQPVYNTGLLGAIAAFRRVHKALIPKFPSLDIAFAYATRGDTNAIHNNVRRKEQSLRQVVQNHFADSSVRVDFLGARELLVLARRSPSRSFALPFQRQAITSDNCYACLVNLRDYYQFITDEGGSLRKSIFEANVRDYQGTTEVNRSIQATLEQQPTEDFWWLNNGVTVVAARGSITGDVLTLEDAEVVNGLQTSREVFDYFSQDPTREDARNILVRVIVTEDDATRDNIIKATNSQTPVQPASLRATDAVQRDIETFFLTQDLFYDRRKNYHRNQGRPIEKVISIGYLAQAAMAITLREPNNSRARPSTLLKSDTNYKRVFSRAYPIEMYLACARAMKRVDMFIRSAPAKYLPEEKVNLRFHVAMCAAVYRARRVDYEPTDIPDLGLADLSPDFLADCMDTVVHVFRRYRTAKGDTADKAAKSRDFDTQLLAYLRDVGVPAIVYGLRPVQPSLSATVPSWESPVHRFLTGQGELVIVRNGPAFTLWDALLHFGDELYPIEVGGEVLTKEDLLLHASEILSTDPEVARPWIASQERLEEIQTACVQAGWDPRLFESMDFGE